MKIPGAEAGPRAPDAGHGGDPERALALSYAPAPVRPALAALLALDDTLGQILRTTREPLIGQMRLTWWHGALSALDTAPPPAQPVLQALVCEALPRGVSGATLARMVEGWEALLDEDVAGEALARHATLRGAGMFRAAAIVLGVDGQGAIDTIGRGWAYADLARNLRDDALCALARERALVRLPERFGKARLAARARSLGGLALNARMSLEGKAPPGAPRRVARLAWHRLTGR